MEKYVKNYEITSYECDRFGRLRLRTLFNYFQDLADGHANEMGVGYHTCVQKGIGWIGGAYHVQINRLPKWEDKVTLHTWPSGTTAVTGIRDFRMLDDKGVTIVNATSQWVLVDTQKMRPISVAKNLGQYTLVAERALESTFAALPEVERVDTEKFIPVRNDDIDINKHVNNAVYPTLALDGLSDEFLHTHEMYELQILFKKPAVLSDIIHLKTQIDGYTTIHQLFNETDEIEFARIKIDWK